MLPFLNRSLRGSSHSGDTKWANTGSGMVAKDSSARPIKRSSSPPSLWIQVHTVIAGGVWQPFCVGILGGQRR